MNSKSIETGSLVMIRFSTNYGYSNTWWEVMFIDNDNTFIGKLKKCHWFEFTEHKIGDFIKLNIKDIQHIWKVNEQFCYGDNITICDCIGLCRNK